MERCCTTPLQGPRNIENVIFFKHIPVNVRSFKCCAAQSLSFLNPKLMVLQRAFTKITRDTIGSCKLLNPTPLFESSAQKMTCPK